MIPISALFSVFLFISSVVGLMFGNINTVFVIQMCEYIIPILMMGFSRTILDNLESNENLKKKWERIVIVNSYGYILCTILFRLMYNLGIMYWSAYTSSVCLFIIPYLFFATDKTFLAFALCAAAALSGGRSTLVRTLLIVLVYYFTSNRDFKIKVRDTLILIIGAIVAFLLVKNTHYFDRILLSINTMLEEDPDLDLATGGRVAEFERIVRFMNERPISWVVGNGFGVYQTTTYGSVRGFAHFMPLTYTMISGVLFTVVLYFGFLMKSLKLFFTKNSLGIMFFCYLMIVVVIGSFFDASIMTDYKYWLLVGFSFCYIKQKNEFSRHSLLI